MNKVHWYRSIRFRIPAILVLIILIPTIAFWYYFSSVSRDNLIDGVTNSMYTSLYGSSLLLEEVRREVNDFSRSVCTNNDFIRLIESYLQETEDEGRIQREISLMLSQYAGDLRTLDSMYLLFEGRETILSTDPYQKQISTETVFGGELYSLYSGYFKNQIEWYSLPGRNGEEETSLAYVRPVKIHGEIGCSLVCTLKKSAWEDAVYSITYPDSKLYVSNYEGRLLLSTESISSFNENIKTEPVFSDAFPTENDYGTYFFGEGESEQLVMYYSSVESGWKYLASVPLSQVLSDLGRQNSFIFITAILGFISVALGSILLYGYVVKPVNGLMQKMRGMENGELQPIAQVKPKNEIGVLLQSYNHMIVELKNLIDEVYVQQLLRKQAQLKSLQSQMDEHFLYNTINTIYCEACREKADNSANMLVVLSKYFRLSLAKGQDKVGLDQIAELVRYYLQIQKMRFGPSLRCQIETFPDMDQYVALKYLFQPIVENAIVHGFEKKLGTHLIHIRFQRQEELLYFEVTDDGNGIEEEQLKQIIHDTSTSDKVEGDDYALKNLREQIRITYGEEYRIFIESQKGKGTKVYFTIPLERRTEQDA